MKGKHHVLIETKRIKYEFDIKRNITIIQGNSATGKTTLVNMLFEYATQQGRTGMILQSDVPCVVFQPSNGNWKDELALINDSIVFIDEQYSFIRSKEFADVIKGTSNYYVLITRWSLPTLPYSVKEIYGIRTTGKYHYPDQIYHEFYPIYPEETNTSRPSKSRILITEDGNSGFQFFKNTLNGVECFSANGNSQVFEFVKKYANLYDISVIADGAAFGAFIRELYIFKKENPQTTLFFPESFEWMILKSGILSSERIDSILQRPEDYIESFEFFSWERFFTALLTSETFDDRYKAYKKENLSNFYLEGKNAKSILSLLPDGFIQSMPVQSGGGDHVYN